MIKSLSENITKILVKNNIIPQKNKEIYSYGFRQLFMMTLNILIILGLGLIFKEVWQSILFSVVYIPLRSYAGGFHASTPVKCTVFSSIMVCIALLLMKYVTFSKVIIILMLIFSILVIVILSPVHNSNKFLDDIERKVYKQRTLIILAIEVIITLVTLILDVENVCVCFVLSLVALSIMLILGKIVNLKEERKIHS